MNDKGRAPVDQAGISASRSGSGSPGVPSPGDGSAGNRSSGVQRLRDATARGVRGDLREIMRPWILLAPALVVLLVLFVGAIVLAVMQSLQWIPILGQTDLSFEAYTGLFTRREFWPSLWLTLYIGVVSTAVSIVIGVAFALLLRRLSYRFRFLTFLFQINLPVPGVVSAAAIVMLLGRSGTVSRVLERLNMISEPTEFPLLIFDPWAIGIMTSYIWLEIPFITVIALAQLKSTVVDYEVVAQVLGAGTAQRLRFVTIPIIMPGVLTASVVVFAFTFGSYEVPSILGRSFPQTLPVLALRLHNDVDLTVRPQGMAITMVVTLITVILVAVYMKVARTRIRREGR